LFVDADGTDDVVGTEDDNLRLQAGSPCIDAGNNAAVPPEVTVDLDGNPRYVDDPDTPDCPWCPDPENDCGTPPIVDMGAYEYFPDCNNNDIPDTCDVSCGEPCDVPGCGESEDCNGNGLPDDCEADDDGDDVINDCDNCPTVSNADQADCNNDGEGNACDLDPGEQDADADGVCDDIDECPNTIPGIEVDEVGCPPLVPGDFDRDGDVDQEDFGIFQRCSSGPNIPGDPNCAD